MRRFLFQVLVFSFGITSTGHATLLGSVGHGCMKALGSTGACRLRGPELETASLRAESMARARLAHEFHVSTTDPRVSTVFVEARRLIRGEEPYLPIDVKFKVAGVGSFTYRSRFAVCTKPIAFIGVERLPKIHERLGKLFAD